MIVDFILIGELFKLVYRLGGKGQMHCRKLWQYEKVGLLNAKETEESCYSVSTLV